MNAPLVSVIMPAYRCADHISLAIDSALNQEVPVEVLVIDDCSPDHLDEVMARYAENDAVRYIRNEQNMGAAQSRNRGIQLAKAPYVAFLDSDDYWVEGKLKKQLEALEKTGAVLCATARELMSPEGVLSGRIIPIGTEITYRDMLKQNSINCSSVLMKTEVAREFPMHHEDSHEDYIMWLEILGKYERACGINEPLLKYRLSNTGKSGSKLKSARMTFMVYRYMGFGWAKSAWCFCNYALNGVKKYYLSRNGEKHEA